MTKPLKPATTFEQQINLLESRGLVITDRERAKEVLSRYNYYKLSGDLFNFRKPGSDDYEDGLTFDRIMVIIEFDRRFRNVLMYRDSRAYFEEEDIIPHGSFDWAGWVLTVLELQGCLQAQGDH